MKANYISPYEGSWHQNDFKPGEKYVADDHIFTCITSAVNGHGDVELTVEWESWPGAGNRVWPNIQWIALNWEDE